MKAPCPKLYQIDFDKFQLLGPKKEAFGTFKVFEGLLLGDNVCD